MKVIRIEFTHISRLIDKLDILLSFVFRQLNSNDNIVDWGDAKNHPRKPKEVQYRSSYGVTAYYINGGRETLKLSTSICTSSTNRGQKSAYDNGLVDGLNLDTEPVVNLLSLFYRTSLMWKVICIQTTNCIRFRSSHIITDPDDACDHMRHTSVVKVLLRRRGPCNCRTDPVMTWAWLCLSWPMRLPWPMCLPWPLCLSWVMCPSSPSRYLR
jgi:hypothetical protein